MGERRIPLKPSFLSGFPLSSAQIGRIISQNMISGVPSEFRVGTRIVPVVDVTEFWGQPKHYSYYDAGSGNQTATMFEVPRGKMWIIEALGVAPTNIDIEFLRINSGGPFLTDSVCSDGEEKSYSVAKGVKLYYPDIITFLTTGDVGADITRGYIYVRELSI